MDGQRFQTFNAKMGALIEMIVERDKRERSGDSACSSPGIVRRREEDAENLPNGSDVIGQISREKPKISIWIQV
jgi:hypothetical protein